MRRRSTALAAVTLALLAGCATSAPGTQDGADTAATDSTAPVAAMTAAPLEGVDWTLHDLGGQPAVGDDPARLPSIRFDADSGRASGSGGCNRIAGPYTRDGDSLRIGPLISTRMACADDRLTRQETDFLAALDGTRSYRIEGDTLTLRGDGTAAARLVARR